MKNLIRMKFGTEMTNHNVILMTALVPTIGHKFLIDFAQEFQGTQSHYDNILHVIICARDFEPVDGWLRFHDLSICYKENPDVLFHLHNDDNAPQNPEGEDDVAFWRYWRETIQNIIGDIPNLVFASEKYGQRLADAFESEDTHFIPVDINREVISTRGTNVRSDIVGNWDKLLPGFQYEYNTSFVMFGAESVGKTTLAKQIYEYHKDKSYYNPEWARPYLETVGPKLNDQKLLNIVYGETALINATPADKPLHIRDTDLLSTIGYYRIYGKEVPKILNSRFRETKADHYFMISQDNVPFVPDPLRYGGDMRESTDQFWIDILKEFDCSYTLIDGKNIQERKIKILHQIELYLKYKFSPIKHFTRE